MTNIEKKISEIMMPIHEMSLRQLPIPFSTLMRAGLEIAYYAKEETLDDNGILSEDESDNFIDKMIKQESEPATEFQKKMIEEIKINKHQFVVLE